MGRDMGRSMSDDTKKIALDRIEDPEQGVALLSKDPPDETPEQRKLRKFWLFQFECWRDWLAGDSLAIPRAIHCCYVARQLPPRWLVNASVEFAERGLSGAEKERQNDFARHYARWEAVEASKRRERYEREELRTKSPKVRRRLPPRMSSDDHFHRAADVLDKSEAVASVDTIIGSYKLIQYAGGANATFESYRRAAKKFNRHRRWG
jgi:hypothetical protein